MPSKIIREDNNWPNAKNNEFRRIIYSLSEYTKKGVLDQIKFYLIRSGTSNDVISESFGFKFLDELKLEESSHRQKIIGTYADHYQKIEYGKRVNNIRLNLVLSKFAYDFDMNESVMHSFFETIVTSENIQSKGPKSNITINMYADKGIEIYKNFLIGIDKKLAKDTTRTVKSIVKIIDDSFNDLIKELSELIDNTQNFDRRFYDGKLES